MIKPIAVLVSLFTLWAGLECGYRIGRQAEADDHWYYVQGVVKGDYR